MTEIEALDAQVKDALAVTERRIETERMQQANDAALARMAQQGAQVQKLDVIALRLQVLVEVLLGGEDDIARWDYEHAVQMKFTEVLGELQSQVTRATLLNGVRIVDPRGNGQRP